MTTRYAILHTHGNSCIAEVLQQGERTSIINTSVSKSEIVLTSRLTFLSVITITPEGHGREINPLGDKEPYFYRSEVDKARIAAHRIGSAGGDHVNEMERNKINAWRTAEAALRTMPVVVRVVNEKIDEDTIITHAPGVVSCMVPGTTWLAHEVNGKWVIVRRAEG